MNSQQAKEIIGTSAEKAAYIAAKQAKQTSGIWRWIWGIGATLAAAIAWFYQSDSQEQPDTVSPPAYRENDI